LLTNCYETPMDTDAATLARYQMYIDGQWVNAGSGEQFESHNPYTGKRGR